MGHGWFTSYVGFRHRQTSGGGLQAWVSEPHGTSENHVFRPPRCGLTPARFGGVANYGHANLHHEIIWGLTDTYPHGEQSIVEINIATVELSYDRQAFGNRGTGEALQFR